MRISACPGTCRLVEVAEDEHDLVGGRIEDGTEARTLIEPPRDQAVEDVGDRGRDEQNKRGQEHPAEGREQKHRDQDQAQEREEIWDGQHWLLSNPATFSNRATYNSARN